MKLLYKALLIQPLGPLKAVYPSSYQAPHKDIGPDPSFPELYILQFEVRYLLA